MSSILRQYVLYSLLMLTPYWISGQALTSSNLPIVIINTQGGTIVDEPKIPATMKVIDNPEGLNRIDDEPVYDGVIGIEIRGQSSQSLFPKKGYGIETRDEQGENLNVPLMGMPEENDWVIHSPYSDKSLIRNAMAYSIAGEMMPYAPRVRMAELIINNRYEGVILWTEKIKRDRNRVAINNLREDENEGDDLTGGYILRFDKGNEVGWVSKFKPNLPNDQDTRFLIHTPDIEDITTQQLGYIKGYVDDFEAALMGDDYKDPIKGYAPYIDVESYVNTIILNELTRNVDGYRLSTYMYKDKDSENGKLTMGPTWDHNLAWGNADYCFGSRTTGWGYLFNAICPNDFWVNHVWWERLLSDDNFRQQVKDRWQELREGILSTTALHQRIDDYTEELDEAKDRNFDRWPVIGSYVWPNEFVGNSYDEEIDYLKNWIEERTAWLDRNFNALTAVQDITDVPEIKVYPNPAIDYFNIETTIAMDKVEVYNLRAQLLLSQQLEIGSNRIDISNIDGSQLLWYRMISPVGELVTGTIYSL